MLDTIGAFGSGIGTNLLSDSLSKKLSKAKKQLPLSPKVCEIGKLNLKNRMTALSSQTAHFIHM